MSRHDIERQIRDYLADNFLFGRSDMLQNDSALLGNIIDSTGTLELVGFLQRNFKITVEDEDIVPENLDSISRLVTYVEGKMPPAT
ncbi:MAG: acyl carrier protein [Candidatus Acidiferrales bacterium]